jgi:hypothetical protein
MIKNRKFFMCFSINTTHSGRETSNFACDKYLTIFAMDILKYVLTAVIITSAFEELSGAGWLMYLVGIGGAILLLAVSIFIIHITNKDK